MEKQRLDALARGLATGTSRRSMVRGLMAGIAGLTIGVRQTGAHPANVGLPRSERHPPPSPTLTPGLVGSPCVPIINSSVYQSTGYCIDECQTSDDLYAGNCAVCNPTINACVGVWDYPCFADSDCVPAYGVVCVSNVCKAIEGGDCVSDGQCTNSSCVEANTGETCNRVVSVDPTEAGWTAPFSDSPCHCHIDDTATITVHLRCCPEGATDVYAECHPNGIAGVAVELEALLPADHLSVYSGVTDTDGNFTFVIEAAGPWTLMTDIAGAPMSMYCSYIDEVGTETYLDISGGITLPHAFTHVICDLYYTGVCEVTDGGESGGDTELPETGTGASTTSLIAGAAIVAGGAALLGKVLKGNAEA